MNKQVAIVWGLATLTPFIYMAYFMLSMMDLDLGRDQFDFMFTIHMIMMLVIWGLIASYVVYLFKTDYVAKEKKALWAVVLFLGHMLAMPVFWYLYVWRPIVQNDA